MAETGKSEKPLHKENQLYPHTSFCVAQTQKFPQLKEIILNGLHIYALCGNELEGHHHTTVTSTVRSDKKQSLLCALLRIVWAIDENDTVDK